MEATSAPGIKHFLEEIQKSQAVIRDAVQETQVQLARLDERQQETTRKVDLMSLALANQYVGSIEFGLLKKEVLEHKLYADQERAKIWKRLEDLEEARDSDRTWFIRLTLGGFFAGILALFGVKKGIF